MTDTPDNTDTLAPAANPDLRWYVVHAYSGMEKAAERNIVERMFNKLKHFRRIATRYDKTALSFMAFLNLAAIYLWLK